VQGRNGECGLTLRLWNTRLFIIDDGATGKLKEPRCEMALRFPQSVSEGKKK
jgi:hypothetical protein